MTQPASSRRRSPRQMAPAALAAPAVQDKVAPITAPLPCLSLGPDDYAFAGYQSRSTPQQVEAFSRWVFDLLHWTACTTCQAANTPMPLPTPLAQAFLLQQSVSTRYLLMIRRLGGYLAAPEAIMESLQATQVLCDAYSAQQADRLARYAALQHYGSFHPAAPSASQPA